ncbi:hypothetical protein HMPREF9120_01288 [Neisseria sp. oral taxon 020 str. F0370]|nr:hypothetical protein HMPREF9120_01288 [Neisseria sp. oral taxon 020 str. F0370]
MPQRLPLSKNRFPPNTPPQAACLYIPTACNTKRFHLYSRTQFNPI